MILEPYSTLKGDPLIEPYSTLEGRFLGEIPSKAHSSVRKGAAPRARLSRPGFPVGFRSKGSH